MQIIILMDGGLYTAGGITNPTPEDPTKLLECRHAEQ